MIWVKTTCPGCGKERYVAMYARETEKLTKHGCGTTYKVNKGGYCE